MVDAEELYQDYRRRVLEAAASETHLALHGGKTKAFYGRTIVGEPFDLSENSGIVEYIPSELVITARAGTPLHEIEQTLAANGQMLPFEPPHYAAGGTLGGAIASGLSGPRRPWGGAPRDLLLGVKLMDGQGRILTFGGQVMKNVAGYDLSRLMAGALGSLGILLEVSVKVLPAPLQEWTLQFETDSAAAPGLLTNLLQKRLPVSASFARDKILRLRLACSEERLLAIQKSVGGERLESEEDFWLQLRDHGLEWFHTGQPLWRLSLPRTAQAELDAPTLDEWAGAQRWLISELPAAKIREAAACQGGHAVLFRNGARDGEIFHPLPERVADLHRRLKQVFDPQGVFNPGRLYPDC